MPWFEYLALTPGGAAMTGRLESPAHDRAAETVRALGLELRELTEVDKPVRSQVSISAEDLIFFNEQLASLAEAGIALDEGLAQLAHDIDSPSLRRWIHTLVADLRRGVPLEQAIAAHEQGLPLFYSRVIRSAVASGNLPATLMNLNQHLRLMGTTRRIMWETASYPLLVVAFGFTIFSVFFLVVAPQFQEIVTDFGAQLPFLTAMMFTVADHYLTIVASGILLLVGCVIVWRLMRFSRFGRRWRDKIIAALPGIGRLQQSSLLARFFRATAQTLATGMPLPDALRLGADATGNERLMADADHLAAEVERGQSIFVANQSSRMIPPLFGFCVQTAMNRNTLPESIDKLACAYEGRAVHAQALLRAWLYPVLIVGLGAIVATFILALFLPLVSLINSISG